MILPIYIYGQPVLRKVSEDITPDYPDLQQLIANMYETLSASEGIGLAAPQIGKAIRLVIIDLDPLGEDFPEYKDFRKTYINPHIVERDAESEAETLEEGCLSLPGIHEKVTRPTRIHVKYMDDQFLFSAHYKSYRKIKRNKQYTLAPFEEIYGGFSDYTLFFFQTLYDFYHEQFYSNPYYIEGLNRRLLKRIYIGCLTALCSTKLVPQYELDGVMDEFNNSLAE